MRVFLVAVGKLKKPYVQDGIKDYAKRIKHYIPFEIIETPKSNPMELLQRRGIHVILDPNGKEMTSEEFASFLGNLMNTSSDDVFFYIGGSEGFEYSFTKNADYLISLSKMTLPHELARLVFLEQLYRALTIIRGEKYHK